MLPVVLAPEDGTLGANAIEDGLGAVAAATAAGPTTGCCKTSAGASSNLPQQAHVFGAFELDVCSVPAGLSCEGLRMLLDAVVFAEVAVSPCVGAAEEEEPTSPAGGEMGPGAGAMVGMNGTRRNDNRSFDHS